MVNSSDGPTLPMPDFSVQSSSTGDMRFHLKAFLDSKEKQLQYAGTLGQRVLAQQMELEERIGQLAKAAADKSEDDELDAEVVERYRELAGTIRTWDAENAQLSSVFESKPMANFSNEPTIPTIPMPEFSVQSSSTSEMKLHLQALLDNKEKELQQAGTLGQRVLAQQMELEERIRQLREAATAKGEDDELDTEVAEHYRELAETIRTWDAENAQLSSAFRSKFKEASPSMALVALPREGPEQSKEAGSSAAQSRRAKNAAHRADDVEFAFEIGSGLLTEVRRLQSLLVERDKAIQDMKEDKDDLEKSVESLRTALRQQEQSADKFKEENWNLEVTLQELRAQQNPSNTSNEGIQTALRQQLDRGIEENRNLESSLRERDKTIQDIKKEMDRFEYLADYFRTALRQQEQSIEVAARDRSRVYFVSEGNGQSCGCIIL